VVNVQIHSPAALRSEKEPLLSNEAEAGWDPTPIFIPKRREIKTIFHGMLIVNETQSKVAEKDVLI
jgi:hypothetical protein